MNYSGCQTPFTESPSAASSLALTYTELGSMEQWLSSCEATARGNGDQVLAISPYGATPFDLFYGVAADEVADLVAPLISFGISESTRAQVQLALTATVATAQAEGYLITGPLLQQWLQMVLVCSTPSFTEDEQPCDSGLTPEQLCQALFGDVPVPVQELMGYAHAAMELSADWEVCLQDIWQRIGELLLQVPSEQSEAPSLLEQLSAGESLTLNASTQVASQLAVVRVTQWLNKRATLPGQASLLVTLRQTQCMDDHVLEALQSAALLAQARLIFVLEVDEVTLCASPAYPSVEQRSSAFHLHG